MRIPVYYELEDEGDEYCASLVCPNCDALVYDDRLGWLDDPDGNLADIIADHRHQVGQCQAKAEEVEVSFPNKVINLDDIPF